MPPEAEVAAYPESAKMLLASANAHILRERSTVSELRRMLQVTQARYDRANLAREIFLARSSGGTYTSAQNAVKAADTLLALTYPKVADDIRDDCWPLAAFNPGPILAEPVMVTPSNLAARVSSVTDEEYRRDLARDILLQNPHSPKAAMQLADEFMAWSKTPVPEAPAPDPLTSSEQYAEASNRG